MKVLYLINNLGAGGAEKLLEELLPILKTQEQIEVHLVILTDESNVYLDSIKNKGIQVKTIEYNNIYDIRNVIKIKKEIIVGKYDIVHSHLFPTQYWVAISRMITRKPSSIYLTTEHSTHNKRRNSIFRLIEKRIYKQYDVIISISNKVQENLIKWNQPSNKVIGKYKVIENGINLEKYQKANAYKKNEINKKFSEDTILLCMVGRFAEAKDQDTIIKALKYLPNEVELLLVGDGNLIDDSRQVAIENLVNDRVHFLGYRSDIPEILKTVDIVVLSSHWEGLSLSCIEGLASGKPMIGSDVEGIKDILEGYGVLFEESNELDLAQKINDIISDSALYDRVKNKCLIKASEYEIKTMATRIANLYRSLLQEKERKS